MTRLQRIQLKQSEARKALAEMLDTPEDKRSETFTADLDAKRNELTALESELQAALVLDSEEQAAVTDDDAGASDDAEGRELRQLQDQIEFSTYIAAALAGHGIAQGPEAEYNQHLNIPGDWFPLELLTRDIPGDLETRAAVDGDARTNQGTWVDRLFAATAARRLGISMPTVQAGVGSFPVTTGGGAPAQRGRDEPAAEGTFAFTVTELRPTRNAVHMQYSIEDAARVPGLADAIQRDMRNAMTAAIDKAVFVGDAGANEASADIIGLTTASIEEITLTQANKVKADETLKALLGLVDGIYAASMDDVRIVATVGSNQLWGGTIHNAAASNETVGQFLRSAGVSWITKGDVEGDTAAGDFGAFVGLQRGIAGAGVAPIWNAAQMIRDPYSQSASGSVNLTLNYLWAFGIPRAANFKRLKYVA